MILSAEGWLVVASVASAISAIAAAVTVVLLLRQTRAQSESEKVQRAAQFMLQYIKLSVENPKLSTSAKGEDYEWYVVATLVMAREVLEAYPNDPAWRSLVAEHVGFHNKELKKWGPEEIERFGPQVAALVADIVRDTQPVKATRRAHEGGVAA